MTEGLFDDLPVDRIPGAEMKIRRAVIEQIPQLCKQIQAGEKLSHDNRNILLDVARNALGNGDSDGDG